MSDSSKAWVLLLEVVAVLTIIVSAAMIAVPKLGDLRRRDVATKVLADIGVMRTAVYAFYSDSAYFPAETPNEAVPGGLEPYLPRTFSSRRPYGTLAYRNWRVGVAPQDSTAPNIIGATVVTHDLRVGAAAAALTPGTPRFTVGNKYTFVFFGT